MTAKDPTEQVVLKYLTLFGAEIQKTQTCYEILAPLELAKALEGLPYPNKNQYRFSFQPCDDPEVEVIRPGSSRLERIVGTILQKSFFARAFFPGSPLAPSLLVHFKVVYLTDQRLEELLLLNMDLMTGEIQKLTLKQLSLWGEAQREPGDAHVLSAKISYEDAFQTLCSHVKSLALSRERDWARSARIRWREAILDLESHYQRALRERGGEEKALERERRLRELEMRYRPRILAIPLNFALVYTPMGTSV